MKDDIKGLLEIITDMAAYTECDLVFVEGIANKHGLTIDEDLEVKELEGENR
ncbi:hypothetical protein [Tepidibacter hydrothermalis]|uniref:Phage protein n=1 Tax=Tepidibacter hydrothermalis TaxID=3036126 RepID=A0ABY8EGB3_9FIRM|nr:hypothetical protein [Tepidibacter hydrothermalis]WFD11991.1 hypothetical protein P4S50_07910 [Tepidibacter hydrothermalis]